MYLKHFWVVKSFSKNLSRRNGMHSSILYCSVLFCSFKRNTIMLSCSICRLVHPFGVFDKEGRGTIFYFILFFLFQSVYILFFLKIGWGITHHCRMMASLTLLIFFKHILLRPSLVFNPCSPFL